MQTAWSSVLAELRATCCFLPADTSPEFSGLDPGSGKYFVLNTASLSALGYEHNVSEPVIRLWNDDHHVAAGADSFGQRGGVGS